MGIGYSGEHGIGYEVDATDEISEEDLEDGLGEYLENNIEEGFSTFNTNSGYDSEITGTFLVIDDPFKNGLDLS